MARFVMDRASLVYSRDHTGLDYVKNLLHSHATDGNVKFAPDVAVVEPHEPKDFGTTLTGQ